MSLTVDNPHISEPLLVMRKKGSKSDTRIRILVLTSNPFKMREFEQDLATRYGASVTFESAPDKITDAFIRRILSESEPSPHYIIREQSRLYDATQSKELSGIKIVEDPESSPLFVNSTAKLRVWKPIWDTNSQLVELATRKYFHQIHGFIDPSRKELRQDDVFGWDHLFVDARNGLTSMESIQKGHGKISPRQLVISDFVMCHLFYKAPKSLSHHSELKPTQAIEFSLDMSVGIFMNGNRFLSNPNIDIWGLRDIRDRILDEGVFFKAATSRPIRNYFSPPFAGIPLTAKKSLVEETIFMMHDLNHHNIPDLIFDGDDSTEMRNVYTVWRMMSEAMTLVIADMLYADTLAQTDQDYRVSLDSRIYPLFEGLNIETPTEENRWQIIRKLLWANAQYAVLGDDQEWRNLLKSGSEERLTAYKNHFENFFVGDHVWTATNFKNMAAKKESYTSWIERLGKDHFRNAGIILLSDMAERIRLRGADLLSIKDVVRCAFEEIFETRIHPKKNPSIKIDEEERLSRGFCRYITGQMSFYSHYQTFPEINERATAIAAKIKGTSFFGKAERENLYRQYKQDVYYLWGLNVITAETAGNHMQVHPIFPPVYINYARQECKSVKDVLEKLYGEIS